jgi:hypothetical protein
MFKSLVEAALEQREQEILVRCLPSELPKCAAPGRPRGKREKRPRPVRAMPVERIERPPSDFEKRRAQWLAEAREAQDRLVAALPECPCGKKAKPGWALCFQCLEKSAHDERLSTLPRCGGGCGRTLNTRARSTFCLMCRLRKYRLARETLQMFRQEARAKGLDPEELIADFARGWLDRARKAGETVFVE